MKAKLKLGCLLTLALTLLACKGDRGELGPQGAAGPQGPQGTPGSEAVVYSPWIEVKDAQWAQAAFEEEDGLYSVYENGRWTTRSGTDTLITYYTEIATPGVTQSVLDSGIVLYYLKDVSGPGSSVRNFDPYTAYNDWYYVGTTNRTREEVQEHYLAGFWLRTGSDTIPKGKLVLYTHWQGGSRFWYPGSMDYEYNALKQKYTELKPRTDFQLRYVIIPAGTPVGGRLASQIPVDAKDYEAVKKYYRIAD